MMRLRTLFLIALILLVALPLAAQPEMLREIYRDLMRPTVAHSSANRDNLKPNQLKYAREMCETRAILRAARVFTGCGMSTPEEEA